MKLFEKIYREALNFEPREFETIAKSLGYTIKMDWKQINFDDWERKEHCVLGFWVVDDEKRLSFYCKQYGQGTPEEKYIHVLPERPNMDNISDEQLEKHYETLKMKKRWKVALEEAGFIYDDNQY